LYPPAEGTIRSVGTAVELADVELTGFVVLVLIIALLELARVDDEDFDVLVVLDRTVDELLELEVETRDDDVELDRDEEVERDVEEDRRVEVDSLELDVERREDEELLELETAVEERDRELLRVLVVDTRDEELERTLDVDDTRLLLLLDIEPSLYNSNLLPAPQYSLASPGQMKLQSS
tara:strand:- start:510 stop:1046 length:537 start_codon:yes stop_codon:yes gene_type:complete